MVSLFWSTQCIDLQILWKIVRYTNLLTYLRQIIVLV